MQTTGPKRMRGHGFTILELLVVITVMGILTAMSIGKSGRILTGWRMTRATQAFAEELQQAFAIVGRNRKPVIISFRTDSMNLYIRSRPDVAGNVITWHTRNFGKDSEYKLEAGNLTFARKVGESYAPGLAKTLEVYPPGLAAESLSVVLSRQGVSKRVRMLRGGLVQICSTGDTTTC